MKKERVLAVLCLVFLLFSASVRGQKSSAENLFPILGNYANKSVPLGGNATISPDTGASNIGTATISVAGNFKGSVTISPSSGVVHVLNAYPAGTYAVTVRASDFAGFTLTRTFNLTVTNVSSCNTLDFAGIRTAVGTNAFAVAAADFNGDGRQDAATVNSGSNNISILLGNGAGSFGTVTNFALPVNTFSPQSVAVGDFNGDNKADLAVRSFLNGNISQLTVFNGTGTGSFSAPVNYQIGGNTGTYGIAVGDYNGDGRMDIATGNFNSSVVAIFFRNAANNGFEAVTNINLGFTGNSLATADFNADGRHDFVVSRSGGNSVTAFIRNGANNGFDQVSLTTSGSANQVIVGDFTGDGRQDIAATYSGGLDILPRNALGFDAPVAAGFSIGGQMQAGDFNNDGRLDIAYSSGSHAVIAYRNQANTNFDSPAFIGIASNSLNGLAAADFTGDGRLDLAALNSGTPGGINIFRRNGTNTNFDLSPVQSLGSNNFTDAALGDFDNDGRQDLAFATGGSSNIAIYKGSGNGNFTNLTAAVLNNANLSNGLIATADLNGDGNTDLLVGNQTNNGFSLLAGAGNGSFAAAVDFPLGFQPQRFAVGDFNGDGRQDFALNRLSFNQAVIFLRNAANSGFETAVTINLSTTLNNSLIAGDFNNDGNDDLATGFLSSNGFSVILRNAANNGFDAPVFYSGANQNAQLTADDFDADGNQDIIYSSNNISFFAGSANGTFGTPTIVNGNNFGTGFVESGDFNGDGRQDIVASTSNFFISSGRANVAVLLRNATNDGFDQPVGFNGSYINNNSFTQKIIVGEINGDGRQDLLTANSSGSGVFANFSVMPRVCTVDLNLLGALPNALAGQSYSKTIYANGGIAPYNFTVSGLPAGLNFSTTADSVTIFGTPAIGGQFDVSIGISDSNPFAESNIAPNAANALTQVLPLQVGFAPTSANVSISGRVLAANGRAIRGAIVTLTDQNGATRSVRASAFGIFRFEEVEAGQTYVVSVFSKRCQFAPQIVSVSEDVTDLNFTANE